MKHNVIITDNKVELYFYKQPTHIKTANKQQKKYRNKRVYNQETGETFSEKVEVNKRSAGKPKYEKINGQNMYNGVWNDFTKQKIVDGIKEYLTEEYDENIKQFKQDIIDKIVDLTPVTITVEYATILHHGDVKFITTKDDYFIPDEENEKYANKIPRWDIGNLGIIWNKCIDDWLVSKELIQEDNVWYVKGSGGIVFKRVDNFEDRFLKIVIT